MSVRVAVVRKLNTKESFRSERMRSLEIQSSLCDDNRVKSIIFGILYAKLGQLSHNGNNVYRKTKKSMYRSSDQRAWS
ncbi:hypothetical protein MTP99_015687 [Tenebrio molitor]|nr:hypothetical protein MTP99_015687 [Tenebrio molitor]